MVWKSRIYSLSCHQNRNHRLLSSSYSVYTSAKVLKNGNFRVECDANDFAAVLQALNFQVALGTNCTHQQMDPLILTFGKRIEKEDLVLFYSAVHGVQYKKQNYSH